MRTLKKRTERVLLSNTRRVVAAILLVAIIAAWLVWRTLGCAVVSSAPALMCVSASEIEDTLGCQSMEVTELLSARYESFTLGRRIFIRVEPTSADWADVARRCGLQPHLALGVWHVQLWRDGERRVFVSRSGDASVVEIVGIRTAMHGVGELDPRDE